MNFSVLPEFSVLSEFSIDLNCPVILSSKFCEFFRTIRIFKKICLIRIFHPRIFVNFSILSDFSINLYYPDIFFSSGFCFLEYESHKAASLAKRRLETGRIKVWSCDIIVDWADPQEEPDEETMNQVKISHNFQIHQNPKNRKFRILDSKKK